MPLEMLPSPRSASSAAWRRALQPLALAAPVLARAPAARPRWLLPAIAVCDRRSVVVVDARRHRRRAGRRANIQRQALPSRSRAPAAPSLKFVLTVISYGRSAPGGIPRPCCSIAVSSAPSWRTGAAALLLHRRSGRSPSRCFGMARHVCRSVRAPLTGHRPYQRDDQRLRTVFSHLYRRARCLTTGRSLRELPRSTTPCSRPRISTDPVRR